VAAAVILGEGEILGINDSKTLSPILRERLFGEVLRRAEAVSAVAFPAWWIDRFGVGRANREALTRVLALLEPHAGCTLADGNLALGPEIECLPRADGKSAAVASASVFPASSGRARSGAVRGLTLPAVSFCTRVKLRVSPTAKAPSFASNSVGPNSR
jgi:ribonuclease HII